MKIIKKKISDLIFSEYNPRKLTDKEEQDLTDSIKRFGIVDPIIINRHPDRKNIVIGGHQRIKVALKLEYEEIPCVEVEMDRDRERELNIRLNKNNGSWDWDLLEENFELEELVDWGFEEEELDFDIEESGLIEDDEIPEVEEPVCKKGDLWQLGDHRLLCGDATKKEDVERLMNGEKADICFTSPPYNAGNNIRGYFYKNDNDDKLQDDYTKFLIDFTDIMLNYSDYVFVNIQMLESNKVSIINYQYSLKYQIKDILIWNKTQYPPHINKGTFGCKWEYVIAFTNNGKSRSFPCNWQGKYSNVIETENNSNNEFADIHKAGFPVSFPYWVIDKMDFAKLIIDPFLGTGTTLIACEKTNRKCYGMEIDEHYCDVIINRWEEYTGKKAEKIG